MTVRMLVTRVPVFDGMRMRMDGQMNMRTIRMLHWFVRPELSVNMRDRHSSEQQLHNHDGHRAHTHVA